MSNVRLIRAQARDELIDLVDGGRGAVSALRPLLELMGTVVRGEVRATPTLEERRLLDLYQQAERHVLRLDDVLRELQQSWLKVKREAEG
jgi:hypothetical protein